MLGPEVESLMVLSRNLLELCCFRKARYSSCLSLLSWSRRRCAARSSGSIPPPLHVKGAMHEKCPAAKHFSSLHKPYLDWTAAISRFSFSCSSFALWDFIKVCASSSILQCKQASMNFPRFKISLCGCIFVILLLVAMRRNNGPLL